MNFQQAKKHILNLLDQQLPSHLTYHSLAHTLDVYSAAESLAVQEGVGDYDKKLLLTAACYHDAGYLIQATGHEEESCRLARKDLVNFGYLPDEIDTVCNLIIATGIPQLPTNRLEEILADADLDYLGRDDFFILSDKLYEEFVFTSAITNEVEWHEAQIAFFESHHFFTKTAVNLRDGKKQSNLKQIMNRLQTISQ